MKNSCSFAPLLTRPFLRDEIDAELASRSLREFVRQAWPIVVQFSQSDRPTGADG